MAQAPRLNAAQPIINPDDGTMEQPFRDVMNELNAFIPLHGTGTPEGVVDAFQYSVYLDDAGVTGTTEYRKMLTDIAGDTTKGWRLI